MFPPSSLTLNIQLPPTIHIGLPFAPPPPPPGFGIGQAPVMMPPPPGFGTSASLPPPPPGFSQVYVTPLHSLPLGAIPPPPMGFPNFAPNLLPPPIPAAQHHRTRRRDGVVAQKDPFAPPIPSTLPPPPESLPAKPQPPPLPLSTTATISAEPELRDFKKEATSFVPRQAKKLPGKIGVNSRVNATPSTGEATEEVGSSRPDLKQTLINAGFAAAAPDTKPVEMARSPKGADDYEKFMEDMDDLLQD